MSSAAAEQWKNKGNEFYSQKNYNEAINAYSKAIDLTPNNHAYYTNRAAAYANQLQWEKSLADAQKSLQLNRDWVKVHRILVNHRSSIYQGHFRSGLAYLELKRYDEAVSSLQRACQLEPTNDELKKYLSQAEQAKRSSQPKPAPQPKSQPTPQPQQQQQQPPKSTVRHRRQTIH